MFINYTRIIYVEFKVFVRFNMFIFQNINFQ